MRALPLSQLQGPVGALFCDLDGTLTTRGRIEDDTLSALEELDAAGVPLVLVTGRAAGWGHALAHLQPLRAAVAENGGVLFLRRDGRVHKRLALADAELAGWRARMSEAVAAALAAVPGARLSSDSVYREVDLAIDWNEEVTLPVADAERLVELLRGRGLTAFRSSVHVHLAPPGFDKLSGCRAVAAELLGDADRLADCVYVGDSLNDAPAFAGFARAVGVGNIDEVWNQLPARPAYLTQAREGAGFRELAARILEIVR
jgi:HAD superfamily hydrolase (TIGR01484 family)